VHGDVCDARLVNELLAETRPDVIVNFAAESHVDRSILSPAPVFETNLRGTFTLLEAARLHQSPRFLHVSTDEVYGSIEQAYEADESYRIL
jgi:dTDP-glucose 4,6-dehydratase